MAGYLGSVPVPQATQHRESFTCTEGQTSFATAGYTPQFVDVYLNGSHLSPADFVATNSSDVVLVVAASADDICDIVSYTPFEVANQTFTGTTTMANLSLNDGTDNFNIGVTTNKLTIKSTTSDGSDDTSILIDAGAGGESSSRGGYIEVHGNETSADPGKVIYQMGSVSGSTHEFRKAGGNNAVIIDSSGEVGIGIDVPLHALHINASATGAIPTNAGIGVSDAHPSYFGFHNISNSATYSGIALETRTSGAARWLIANEWKDTYLGDLVFRARSGGSASAERFRIKSDGKVGIATAAPQRALSIGTHGTTSAAEVAFGSTTNGTASLLFGDSTSGTALYSGYVQYQHNGDYMLLAAASAERLRVTANAGANVVVADGLTLTNGNLTVASGHGINFAATSDGAGTDTSELLDDYEEGTWSPVIRGAGTAGTYTTTTNYAKYVKVGNKVTVSTYLGNITAQSAGSNYLQITGFPYTKQANHYVAGVVKVGHFNLPSGVIDSVLEPVTYANTTTTFYVHLTKDNAGSVNLDTSEIVSGSSDLSFEVTYFTT